MKRKWKILLVGLIILSIGIALNYENIKYFPFTSTSKPETEIEPSQEIELPQEAMSGKIAFLSTRIHDSWAIHTMDINGSNQSELYDWTIYYPDIRCISTNSITLIAPSPDGKKIAFVGPGLSSVEGGFEGWKEDIYLVNIDGSGLIKLTDDLERDSYPSWSPDGKRILFSSRRDDRWQMYIMDADGGNQVRITKIDGFDPDLSPDGKKIAFVASGLVCSIWIMNADGSNPTAVIGAIGRCPRWSPDGKEIVFQALYTHQDPDGNPYYAWEILVAHIREGDLPRIVKLTNENPLNPYNMTHIKIGKGYQGHQNPSWSSDGKKIFFNLALHDDIQIYVMNADGSNHVKLTEKGTNQYPIFLPTPKK